MSRGNNERVVWIDGEIVPESRATVSIRDRSFRYGDGAFDTTRTFGHRIFKLREHLDRFYRSMRYLDLDPGMSQAELARITEQVVEMNLPLLAPHEDYWVTQRISRGSDLPAGDVHQSSGPTVIVECTPLPFAARAHYYRDGIDVVIPSTRRASPDAITPRAKTHSYLNLIVGDREARRINPNGWAILLDHHGNLSEGVGSNIFIVQDGVVYTPHDRYVLCGISRETAIEEAGKAGIEVVKADIDLYDAYNADEAFVTSTSFCICPVRSFNGKEVRNAAMPGPVTQRIIEGYTRLVDFDFVAQYLRYL